MFGDLGGRRMRAPGRQMSLESEETILMIHRPFAVISTIFLICCVLSSVLFISVEAKAPPSVYKLNQVTIRLRFEPGQLGTRYSIVIRGDGTGDLKAEYPDQVRSFVVSDDQLIKILNMFYSVDFFALSDKYFSRQKAVLKDNETVTVAGLEISDMGWTALTFGVGDFTRTVDFYQAYEHQPLEKIAEYIRKVAEFE
jgi:hypothetical protein